MNMDKKSEGMDSKQNANAKSTANLYHYCIFCPTNNEEEISNETLVTKKISS